MPIYMPHDSWNPGEFASILAIGDSWFWYPRNNILEALVAHPKLKEPYRNIQVLGQNGAQLSEFVFGRYADDLERQLLPGNSQYYSAILVSGAGNDAVNYSLALKGRCTGLDTPDACIDPDQLDRLVKEIGKAMGAVIHDVWWEFAKQDRSPDIFIHGYDYPVPDGRGFDLAGLTITGPWLRPALENASVANDAELREGVCRRIVDDLNTVFERFDDPARGVHYIDCRKVLRTNDQYLQDWDNELHPTFSGFKRVVSERWIPLLARFGYARA